MTGWVTRPPALRRTGASPSLSPRVIAGSIRWSRQVTTITCAVGRPSGTGVKVRANCSLCSSSGVILLVMAAPPCLADTAARPCWPGSSGKRYEFRPPWAVTRRCLLGGRSRRGDLSPEGATGPSRGRQHRVRLSRLYRNLDGVPAGSHGVGLAAGPPVLPLALLEGQSGELREGGTGVQRRVA